MGANSTRQVVAAGAVVWRVVGRRLQVLLIHRPRYDDWSWPKGKLDEGESLPRCAVREVKEETGLSTVLGVPLPAVRYKLANGTRKVCHYWAATVAPVDSRAVVARGSIKAAPKHEVDEARWVDVRTARKLLTRADDREPLGVLADLWDDGLLSTWTLLVARHGRAKSRSAWDRDEETRPLTPVGVGQAEDLVQSLAAFGVEEVISSPWERCTGTMVPYLSASGLDLITAPQITETAAKQQPAAVKAFVDDFLGKEHEPTVVCTHRPVLPFVLEAIARRSPHRVQKMLPAEDPYLRTGEVLVVHMARRPGRGARVVSVERFRGCP